MADQRIKTVLYSNSQLLRTTWYAGLYEKVVEDTLVKHCYYINSPDGLIAMAIGEGSGTPVIYYICKDHLGSITGIMNSTGEILEEYNYDPWGRRRSPVDWSNSNISEPYYTNRGFTGHEHLDMFNLIHMNGRIYDPEISRFLSPDPFIQDPYNLLNYNRYTYCLNNPLKYTDPSGFVVQMNDSPEMQVLNPGWFKYADPSRLHEYNPFDYIKDSSYGAGSKRLDARTIPLNGGSVIIRIVTHDLRNEPGQYGIFQIEILVKGSDYQEFNFIQSVYKEDSWVPDLFSYMSYGGHGFHYNREHRDFYRGDYYRTDDGVMYDQYFEDSPNLITTFQVTICGQRNNKWEAITTILWDYNIDSAGKMTHSFDQTIPGEEHMNHINNTFNFWNKNKF